MDTTSDAVAMPATRCQRMQNLLADRLGVLRGQMTLRDILSSFPAIIDGVCWYRGLSSSQDRLLVACNGALYACQILSGPPGVLSLSAPVQVGTGLNAGKQVRFASYKDETVIAQDGGVQPQRFDGTAMYQLGITPPSAPIAVAGTPSGGATSNKSGAITYKVSLFDSKFRESDLSSGTTIDYSANAGKDGYITVNYGSDPQVAGAYIYANTSGGSVWYRIGTLTKPTPTFEDNLADSTVNTGTVGASPGENAIPNRASCVAVHKNRLWLNDATNPYTIQINNVDSITQFSSITYQSTDGTRITSTTNQGDPIVALQPFGSLLGIVKRSQMLMVWGDDNTTWTIRPLHERGCIAPASFVRCDNVEVFLSDDGIYASSYVQAFRADKISKEIESDLFALQATASGRAQLASAVGWFCNHIYHLAIGDIVYRYDFDTQGWSQFRDPGKTYSGAAVVQPVGSPQVAYLARADAGTVSYLDVYTPNQTVGNITLRSHPFDGETQNRMRLKRAKRLRVFGEGTLDAANCSVTITCDNNRSFTYKGGFSRATGDVLLLQEFRAESVGRVLDVTLSLRGTGLVIRELMLEYIPVG